MGIVINIDETGLSASSESLLVHVNQDLSFTVLPSMGEIWGGPDIRDLIDVAKLVEPILIERYGGYR